MEKFIRHLSWCMRKEQKHDENMSRLYMMATMMERYFDFRWETEAERDQKRRMNFNIMKLEVLVEEVNTLSVQRRDKKNR